MRISFPKSRLMTFILAGAAMFAGLNSCTEENVTEDSILGTYENTYSDGQNFYVRINKMGGSFSMYSSLENFNNPGSKVIEWKGTFTTIPRDKVIDSNGESIGEISFRENEVVFKAYTQEKGTYTAYSHSDFDSRAKEKRTEEINR